MVTLARLSAAATLLAIVASSSAAAQEKTWRHGILEPKSDAGFVMMVTRNDFAKKLGLKIEPVPLKDGQILIKALIAGELDSIEGGAGESLVAGGAGADIKVLGCPWPGLPHAILSKTSVATTKDLKGKAIATSAPGSLPDLLARTLLAQNSMTSDDVTLASIGSDLDRFRALLGGRVDAAVVSSEYMAINPKDIKILAAGRDVAPNFMRLCMAVQGKTLATRRDDTVRFMAAEMQALHFAVTHRDETIALTREISGAKADDLRPEYVFDNTVKFGDVDPELKLPLAKLDWMQQQFVGTGNMKQKLDLAKIVDPSVRADALKLAVTR